MKTRMVTLTALVTAALGSSLGCTDPDPTFSLLSEDDLFVQNNDKLLSAKMDILWVIDNSGSMLTSQTNVAENFNAFIQDFKNNNFDYRMAVTATDAYKTVFTGNPAWSRFRDGTDQTSHSGVFVITPTTPDIINVFMTNIIQGVSGSGDERAFSSFKAALDNADNAGFVRSDSFLAVIMVTDEDDLSRNSPENQGSTASQYLHTVDSYVDYLDNLTQTTGALRRYNVSGMAIYDEACRTSLGGGGRKIANRTQALVDATEGIKSSLCGDFATELGTIANRIIQLATQFYLSRIPKVETIEVAIDGVPVPHLEENPGPMMGGWTYNEEANSIVFHGAYIPKQGARIRIDYDPVKYGG